ncbi:MAG TPA: putative LPS assembly protein LptD [Gemmatimonadaceae bacterium]|nr:putative LPS assembly protein LptD [Gemmatimonadaceae bacterium]
MIRAVARVVIAAVLLLMPLRANVPPSAVPAGAEPRQGPGMSTADAATQVSTADSEEADTVMDGEGSAAEEVGEAEEVATPEEVAGTAGPGEAREAGEAVAVLTPVEPAAPRRSARRIARKAADVVVEQGAGMVEMTAPVIEEAATVARDATRSAREAVVSVAEQATQVARQTAVLTQGAAATLQERGAAALKTVWVPPRTVAATDTITPPPAADTLPRPGVPPAPPDTAVAATVVRDTAAAARVVRDTAAAARVARDTARVRAARGDTAAAPAELVTWPESDSVERSLLERRDYVATRYRGDRVTFNALTRALEVQGAPAAVGRGQALLVGDTISYNDATQIVVVRGDTNILRDPAQNTADVVARGSLTYDIARGHGSISNISTAVTSGEQWFVQGTGGFLIRDTEGVRPATFFVRDGTFTTCDEEVPDYHFRAGEIKMITRNFLVARPATLYIGEVPVMWLPFVFQDIRSGRRSGVLSPRFGISELVRNSPLYRRHVENIGYYFAFSDYLDSQVWMDWRSGARGTEQDPGWTRWNGELRYRWLNRFMTGRIATSHTSDQNDATNTAVSWSHEQAFSQTRRLTTNVNYVTNTRLQRQNAFNPQQVLATISSQASYQQKLGPASLSLGGNRTQYPGRTQVQQTLPTLALAVPTIALARWLEWTPDFRFDNQQTLDLDQPGTVAYQHFVRDGVVDSTLVRGDQRTTTASFSTPLKLFGWTWQNSFSFNDRADDYPTEVRIADPDDRTAFTTRTFARTYQSGLDWQTGISLPALFGGTWNVSPSINFRNVDPGPMWVRSQFTGGHWVNQSKRMDYALSVSPTLFALLPGIGPLSRLRHSISPRLSYSYSPEAEVDREYLRATNRTAADYLGNLTQNQVSLHLSQVLEAKLGGDDTTDVDPGRKLRLLSVNFTPLTYDFERKRATGKSGFTTQNFQYDIASDLLPGFGFRVGYSLFQGSPLSDTAVFKPYREDISASFSFNERSPVFTALGRIFGRAVPHATPQIESIEPSPDDALAQRIAGTPVAGSQRRDWETALPTAGAWQATFAFSSQRQREPTGGTIIDFDPAENCRSFFGNPLIYQQCLLEQQAMPTASVPFNPVIGAPFIRVPPRETLQWHTNFHITPKWAAQWRTTYDFRAREFASHQVTLERQLHDWRSNFSFTKAPNGNFSFMFFISLIAQPDLKFNYDKQTYRPLDR